MQTKEYNVPKKTNIQNLNNPNPTNWIEIESKIFPLPHHLIYKIELNGMDAHSQTWANYIPNLNHHNLNLTLSIIQMTNETHKTVSKQQHYKHKKKSVSWPKEDIVSGMLPVNWLSESDLHKEKIISPLMSTLIYGPFNAFTWKSLFLEAHLWI